MAGRRSNIFELFKFMANTIINFISYNSIPICHMLCRMKGKTNKHGKVEISYQNILQRHKAVMLYYQTIVKLIQQKFTRILKLCNKATERIWRVFYKKNVRFS